MSDRPEYRTLYATFADDADVHALSGDAFKTLIMLKLSLPVTGLGVIYASKLCDQVGCDRAQLELVLGELETPKPGRDRGWIVRDRNVVWIVNAFACEPGMTPANKNHVKFVRKLVAGVDARSLVVEQFKDFYRQWFQGLPKGIRKASATDPNGTANPSESHSDPSASASASPLLNTTKSEDLGKERAAPNGGASLALADLHQEIVAFGARFYSDAPAERRRSIAQQLLALANGEAIEYRGAPIRAGSVDRLIAACRSVRRLDNADSAIAYLLTKLGDSTDLTAAQVARDVREREADERASEAEYTAADTWLVDRPDLAAEIDADLAQRGFANTDDSYLAMCGGMMRRTLVLRAWRKTGAPEAVTV